MKVYCKVYPFKDSEPGYIRINAVSQNHALYKLSGWFFNVNGYWPKYIESMSEYTVFKTGIIHSVVFIPVTPSLNQKVLKVHATPEDEAYATGINHASYNWARSVNGDYTDSQTYAYHQGFYDYETNGIDKNRYNLVTRVKA